MAQIRMLRLMCDLIRLNRIKNEYIKGNLVVITHDKKRGID